MAGRWYYEKSFDQPCHQGHSHQRQRPTVHRAFLWWDAVWGKSCRYVSGYILCDGSRYGKRYSPSFRAHFQPKGQLTTRIFAFSNSLKKYVMQKQHQPQTTCVCSCCAYTNALLQFANSSLLNNALVVVVGGHPGLNSFACSLTSQMTLSAISAASTVVHKGAFSLLLIKQHATCYS